MTTLLHIASRVEAAHATYISVRDFADREEWKARFKGEKVSAHLHGVSIIFTFEIESCRSRISAHFEREWGYRPYPAPHFGGTIHSAGAR